MCGAPATLSLTHARTFPEDFLAIARSPDAGRIAGFSGDRHLAINYRERRFARRQDFLHVNCMARNYRSRRETPNHEYVGWFT